MRLSWSHAVIYVNNTNVMLDFYTRILGFHVTDRGRMKSRPAEIVFLSQDPEEHHQIAMIDTRSDEKPSNTVNHLAFRVNEFDDLKSLCSVLEAMEGIDLRPVSHGITLSIYFNDPEGNGIEVLWDTPWHVPQPQGVSWDVSLSESDALAWVKDKFNNVAGFSGRSKTH